MRPTTAYLLYTNSSIVATKSFTLVNTHELHTEAINDPIAYYIKYQLDITNSI